MYDVAIIIPIYTQNEQALDWLGECIDSALSQDCEVVCVNDGSPIDPNSIIKTFKRINYISIPHAGVAAARNEAAFRATSKAIIPLDCDDRFVDRAISKLLSAWDGNVPLYPDVRKFGLETVDHYKLPEFDCEHIFNHVGFTSVNVLHLRDQWKYLRGWNPSIEFYEDGEYNARLFANFCGKHFPEPLVEYRIHDDQRTKVYKSRAYAYAKKILADIRRLTMPCLSCQKRKKAGSSLSVQKNAPQTNTMAKAMTDVSMLPGEIDGRVLALYTGGKGQGKHYYRGLRTNYAYKVVFGDYVYADPRDVKEEGSTSSSLLVRVKKQETVITQTPVATVAASPAVVAEPFAAASEKVAEKVSVFRKPKTDVNRQAK